MNIQPVTIGNESWIAKENPKASSSKFQRITSWLKETSGVWAAYQLIEKTLRVASRCFKSLGNKAHIACDYFANKLFSVYSAFSMSRIPDTTGRALKVLSSPSESLASVRNAADAVGTLADAGSTLIYSGAFWQCVSSRMMAFAEFLSNLGTGTGLFLKVRDVKEINTLLNGIEGSNEATAPVKKMLEDTKTHSYLKIAKDIASLAPLALGVIVGLVGGTPAFAVASLVIGLAGSLLGVGSYFFKESAPYELLDLGKRSEFAAAIA